MSKTKLTSKVHQWQYNGRKQTITLFYNKDREIAKNVLFTSSIHAEIDLALPIAKVGSRLQKNLRTWFYQTLTDMKLDNENYILNIDYPKNKCPKSIKQTTFLQMDVMMENKEKMNITSHVPFFEVMVDKFHQELEKFKINENE